MLSRRVLTRELEDIADEEGLIIEKYTGSFAVSKDYSHIISVRAVIDLESGKVKTSSAMGLLMIVGIVIATVTVAGLIIVALIYLLYMKPFYENELKKLLAPAIEEAS
jgi:hypothetical protein